MKTELDDNECGCCGGYHRKGYTGDCRNNAERFTLDDVEREKRNQWDVEERRERDWVEMREEVLYILKRLTEEISLKKLNVRKHFTLINAHAGALKIIYKASH
jgi:hypothetical protein